MTLRNVKYLDLVNPIKQYLLNNTDNIDNKYNNIPLCFLKGYKQIIEQEHIWNNILAGHKYYNGSLYIPRAEYSIDESNINNYINKFTSSHISNKFDEYLIFLGINDKLNEYLPQSKFIETFIKLLEFINENFGIYTSEYSNIKPFVYKNKNYSTSSVNNISNIIFTNDINSLIKNLITVIPLNVNSIICQYNWRYV